MWDRRAGRERGMDINMKNTDTKQHLGDVQETALIPLAIRANEPERKTARIHDDKAVEIIRELAVDTEKLDQFFSHEGVIARTILFDETVKKLLWKYPDAVCINIGCGLDDRFTRVDNGKIQWFNVDLADLIEIRKIPLSRRFVQSTNPVWSKYRALSVFLFRPQNR
jgi:O-methyltransferase involved in polyketide biosynthesis